MDVCVLYSGGKDSNLALYKAYKALNITCLVTVMPKSEESCLFHYPNVNFVNIQAEALNIPILLNTCLDDEKSSIKALYEVLKRAIENYQIEGVVTGAIRSTYQASRFQRVCWDLGLWCFNPLWLRDEISLLKEALKNNFEVIFTRVAGYPLKKSLVGRRISREVISYFEGIKNYLNPSGEGGEYETFVLNMPLFKKRLEIVEDEVYGEDYDATLIIKRVRLIKK